MSAEINSTKESTTNKSLFIGCGGSGIETLIRVNELLAGNREMRKRIKEDIAYVVIDTEVSKVSRFTNEIRKQMRGVGMPSILPVQMTAGIHHLNEIVEKNFDRQNDPEALALLKKHWWCFPDDNGTAGKGGPFRAIDIVGNIDEGASQCPAISYLATWNYLPDLKENIESLLNEISVYNTDKKQPLAGLKVYIVSSLAGGTGRGCWNLVAFKIKQCLKDMNVSVDPIGVFFDASCFHKVKDKDQQKSFHINSLTGMSELSAWLRLPNNFPFGYSLPKLSDPKTNVISISVDEHTDRTPIRIAVLIFGKNGNSNIQLKEIEDYYKMAGSALYTLVATKKTIAARENNIIDKVRSFSATTFEVNTVPIRRYLTARVLADYSRCLWEGDSETSKEAADFAGDFLNNPNKGSFFARTGFYVKDKVDQTSPFVSCSNSSDTSNPLATRLMNHAEDLITEHSKDNGKKEKEIYSNWQEIESELKKQNEEEAKNKAYASLAESDEDFIEGWEMLLAVKGLDDKNLTRTLIQEVRNAFYREGIKDEDTGLCVDELKPSLARARKVVLILKHAFEESQINVAGTEESPLIRKIYGVDISEAKKCSEAFNDMVHDKSSRRLADGFKKFGKWEIEDLSKGFKKCKQESIFLILKDYLKIKFERAIKVIKAIDKSLATLELGLKDVEEAFITNMCKEWEEDSEEKIFNSLFTPDNDEAILDDLPKTDTVERIYRRILKPIKKEEDLKKLLSKPSLTAEPLANRLIEEFDNLIGEDGYHKYSSRSDARISISETFQELVRNNVGLPNVKGGDFMQTYFSFTKILEENRSKWNRLLNHLENNESKYEDLLDRIKLFLGVEEKDLVTIKDDDREVKIIPQNILLPSIVGNMVKSCNPWMKLKRHNNNTSLEDIEKRYALVPFKFKNSNEENDFKARVDSVSESEVDLFTLSSSDLPKDLVLVYSQSAIKTEEKTVESPLNYIDYLEYWREWKPQMDLAEEKDGSGYFIFNDNEHSAGWVERQRPYGYVSPIFLTNKVLNELRWRPWNPVKKDKDEIDKRRSEAKSALLFGLLGTDVSEDIQKKITAKGGAKLPFLVIPGRGKGAESLKFVQESKIDKPAWNVNDVLGTILSKSLEFLLGDEAKGSRMRKALLDEKEAFKTVFNDLDKDDRDAICNALTHYLEKQASKHGKDSELWNELLEAWKAENMN